MRHAPHPGTPALGAARGRTALIVLRVLTPVGPGTGAAVHARLAPGYQGAAPGGVGVGTLFLAEASAAALAAAAAATGLAALLLDRHADIPPIGPLPAMYEPVWFPAKALAGATALALLRGRRRTPSAARGRAPTPG
jgi:hypothetical protein